MAGLVPAAVERHIPATACTGGAMRRPPRDDHTHDHTQRRLEPPPTAGSAPGQSRARSTAALDKKAADVVVLDLRSADAFTDYFVICSGQSPRQVKAIADSVEETLREARIRPAHIEGYERAEWVLLDYFDFIVHVFNRETRLFYALDRLWGSAPRLTLRGDDGKRAVAAAAVVVVAAARR